MPPKGADEGASFGMGLLYTGSFAAPAASDFLDGQKVTKEPLGTRPMDYGSAMLRLGP